VTNFRFAADDAERLDAMLGPGVLLRVTGGREPLRDALRSCPETDVLCSVDPPGETPELAPHLRWIALPSAGADHALQLGLVRPEGPVVTTASGIHAVPIAEFVLGLLLQWSRPWPEIARLRNERVWPDATAWARLRGHELADATLAVVGLGAIGRQVARLGRAFGMRVLGTRQSARPGDHDVDVDELLPADALDALLARGDYVVIAVPSTPATHHLIGPTQLARMKSTAFLVNIARGAIVDEAALVEALRDGTIAGAGLDVFETEPLPAESPLWDLPNVILSPHVSGATDRYSARFTDLFLENIARWRAGATLRNVIDPARGY
jgi:phosphoglycerate dehydrogenase-like enzyme